MQNKCFHKVAQCWISIIHFTQTPFFFQSFFLGWLGLWLHLFRQLLHIRPWWWEFDVAHVFNPCDKLLALLSLPSNTIELAVYSPSAAITDKSDAGWAYGTNRKHWRELNKELLLRYSTFHGSDCVSSSTFNLMRKYYNKLSEDFQKFWQFIYDFFKSAKTPQFLSFEKTDTQRCRPVPVSMQNFIQTSLASLSSLRWQL